MYEGKLIEGLMDLVDQQKIDRMLEPCALCGRSFGSHSIYGNCPSKAETGPLFTATYFTPIEKASA